MSRRLLTQLRKQNVKYMGFEGREIIYHPFFEFMA